MLRTLARWKHVFFILTALLVLGLILSRVVGPGTTPTGVEVHTTAEEAGEHIGSRAEVCGFVAEVAHIRTIDGEPTFLNFGEVHPDQAFTAVVWGRHRHQWQPAPEEQFARRAVCVRGEIERHQGTPQIEVTSPDQISAE